MIEFSLNQPLPCSTERHWSLFFDPEWTRALIIEGLGFESCTVGPVNHTGHQRTREMAVIPQIELPATVTKLFGDKLGYTEHGTFDESTQVWTYTLVLNAMAEKIRMGGSIRTEPQGEKRCTRISTMWIDAKIFGVGGMIEKSAEKSMREGYVKSGQWICRWLEQHPA